MSSFGELMKKKVAGIPVAYLALGAAAILAVVAWRMKPSSGEVTGDPAVDAGEAATVEGTDPYDDLATGGTVVVQPQQPVAEEPVVKTNDDWVREGVDYLLKNNKATGSEALEALTTYVNGEDYSYEQGKLINEAIKGIGQPHEPITPGKSGGEVARKQFSNFPGRHTIKGTADNDYLKLAMLYYGTDDRATIDGIQGVNPRLGNTDGPFAVGETIALPQVRPPVFYAATTANRTAERIGAVNGKSADAIKVMNDNMVFPVAVGTRVRVR